jgi:amino acid adenylation domain-containing protein
VPINAAYQQEIIEYIVDDAQISTVLSTTEIYKETNIQETKILHLDTFDFTNQATENLEIINLLSNAAFIIYTSGSTGKPKGVIQTHQMLSNLIQWNTLDANIDSGLKHLQYTSFSFDVSLQDCWFALSTGGTLFITPEEMKVDFKSLSDYIIQKEIEAIYFPYAAMSNFLEQVSDEFNHTHNLKHIISSGEQLTINKGIEIFLNNAPAVKLHNHYGPSETHVVTSYTLTANESKIAHVPIGKPVANTTIYLLDENLQAVPTQVIGELYVGGKNVAKGYVNLPELTQSRFIKNPFNEEEQLYKTGDLGVKDANGILNYLGRNDDQVKIRGYRIELSAIKNVLLNQEEIHQAYVTVIRKQNENVLVAYILGEEFIDTQHLKQQLGKQLPEYMVPNYIKTVAHLPLTANGKIDKDALPEITEEALVKGKFLAPETTVEKGLVDIWNKILETASIGVLDNFFELGGHSLHITRMLHDINETFDVKLQMVTIFSSQNIQELAKLIEEEILFKKGTTTNTTEQINNDKQSEIWEI